MTSQYRYFAIAADHPETVAEELNRSPHPAALIDRACYAGKNLFER